MKHMRIQISQTRWIREPNGGYVWDRWEIYKGVTSSYHLALERKVTRRKFTEMPITDSVIKKVEEMAVKDGAVIRISFKNRKEWNTCLIMKMSMRH